METPLNSLLEINISAFFFFHTKECKYCLHAEQHFEKTKQNARIIPHFKLIQKQIDHTETPKKNDKPKKGVGKKATRKTKGKENSLSEIKVISPTMGEQMGKLRLNDNNHLDVSEARLTRSMAKNRSVSMTNIAARKVIL